MRRLISLYLLTLLATRAEELPSIRGKQFLLGGKPYLMLAGELGNSSGGTAAEADKILPKLAKMHFNTVLVPVAWQEIEPQEGKFDFSILDHWITVAREQRVHLVLLWFGSWKNAFSNYAPEWVRADTKRFPRAIGADGLPTEILSTLGEETLRGDARAFSTLMRHVKETDSKEQTVLMVQVENEIGFLGRGGRDRSAAANKLFEGEAPKELHGAGRSWKAMFGETADEVFMAWHYALFLNEVAKAGKAEYALPMYANAQLRRRSNARANIRAAVRTLTIKMFFVPVRPRSIFIHPIFIGRILNIGCSSSRRRATRFLFRKRVWTWALITLCMRMAKRRALASHRSRSTRSKRSRPSRRYMKRSAA